MISRLKNKLFLMYQKGRTDSKASDPSTPPASCLLIQLNLDVLNDIAGHLSPVDHMLFRYTCKPFFYSFNTHEQFTPQNLTSQNRRCYRLQLHRDDPTSYFCMSCDDLHWLDENNLPFNRRIICPKEKEENIFGSTLTGPFQLDHGHVQLACKLAQMNQATLPAQCKRFLGNLLSEFYLPAYYAPNSSIEHPLTFRAQARVIQGRLYLKRTWQCAYPIWREGRSPEQQFGNLQICPHLGTGLSPGDGQTSIRNPQCLTLAYLIINATHGRSEDQYRSCLYCNTDIVVHSKTKNMTVLAWQLLGGYDLESYKYWKAQAWIVDRSDWSLKLFSRLDVDERIKVRSTFELAENAARRRHLFNRW